LTTFSRRILASSLLLALSASIAWAGPERLSSELRANAFRNSRPNARVDVIVRYKSPLTETHHRRIAALGGSLQRSFDAIHAAHYSIPRSALKNLEEDPDVEYVSPDRPVKGMLDITRGAVHSDLVNALGFTGKGIGVAVVDSGIADMPEFGNGWNNRIVFSASFVGSDASDAYGHGTHVAGIIGSSGAGGVYIGMAPGANLINLRALDANGNGTDSSVIKAIFTAILLKNKYNIRVINLSLGRPSFEPANRDPLCLAAEAAWKAGIVVVAAAGNGGRDNSQGTNGYGTITAPGNDPYVITVGAMNTKGTTDRRDDAITTYSSKGPTAFDHYAKPDIVAPGNLIVSTMPAGLTLSNEYPQNQVSPDFFRLSGTSMATPVVSGAAALMLQQNPTLTPDQIKARLMRTAAKKFPQFSVAVDPDTNIAYTSYYDIFTVGAGYLDVAAAMSETLVSSGYALSPVAVLTNNQIALTGVSGQNVVWGANGAWGANVVWGAGNVHGNNVVWGANVIPGPVAVIANNVIWGANVVWGAGTSVSDMTEITGEP
jgi:serine protease AprX